MTLRSCLGRLRADQRGAGAAEFALVLPLLTILLFGIIDGGRLLFEVNRAEKATQMGARYAIVTNVIPAKIANADYVGAVACTDPANPTSYKACKTGDAITNPAALGTVTCTSTGCTGTGSYPSGTVMNTGAFANLVARMQSFDPNITAANVSVSFTGSGIGYAGDPTGMDVVPLVTVKLSQLSFNPITTLALTSLTLPDARTTLSAESSAGTKSD